MLFNIVLKTRKVFASKFATKLKYFAFIWSKQFIASLGYITKFSYDNNSCISFVVNHW